MSAWSPIGDPMVPHQEVVAYEDSLRAAGRLVESHYYESDAHVVPQELVGRRHRERRARLARDAEALVVERERGPERIEVQTVGRRIGPRAGAPFRAAVPPPRLHARSRIVRKLVAERGVQPLHRADRVVLELGEGNVEEAILASVVAELDRSAQRVGP